MMAHILALVLSVVHPASAVSPPIDYHLSSRGAAWEQRHTRDLHRVLIEERNRH